MLRGVNAFILLFPKGNDSGFGVHCVHNGQRLQLIAQIADHPAADLEAFFDGDAQTFHSGTGGFHDGDQSLQGAAVGQEIIYNPIFSSIFA